MDIGGVNASGVNSNSNVSGDVPPHLKDELRRLLETIRYILSKSSYSNEDMAEVVKSLKRLDEMQTQGLGSNESLKLLFLFFKAAGYNPADPYSSITPSQMEALRAISLQIGPNKRVSLEEILNLLLNVDEGSDGTLGEMLLDFMRWGYDIYTSKLTDMQKQLEMATRIINDLKALQDILNQLKIKYPDNYKFPPTRESEIPPEILKKVREAMGNEVDMFNWIKRNADQYIRWTDEYFKKELGFEPNLQPDAIPRLLKARDDLLAQLAILEKDKGADKTEGSPYATIKKVLEDLGKYLPEQYAYGPGQDWDKVFKKVVNEDGTVSYTIPKDLKEGVEKYVKDAQNAQNPIADNLDKAVQSNQTLSSKLSDEIKAQNLMLQTIFDILTQIQKSVHKILEGSAQKISR